MNKELLQTVKIAVRQVEPDAEIYLYGSRARGDFRTDSDWDFLILVDGTVDASRTDRIRSRIFEIELQTGEILSSVVKNRMEWGSSKFRAVPLHRNITREGVLI